MIKLSAGKRKKLIDAVCRRVCQDVEAGDLTAIEELLQFMPHDDYLIGYLDEDQWKKYTKKDLYQPD